MAMPAAVWPFSLVRLYLLWPCLPWQVLLAMLRALQPAEDGQLRVSTPNSTLTLTLTLP